MALRPIDRRVAPTLNVVVPEPPADVSVRPHRYPEGDLDAEAPVGPARPARDNVGSVAGPSRVPDLEARAVAALVPHLSELTEQ